ncbi:MAG TPA: methyltransferase domain-containing protein [Kofleriaceae bacterium]|nr:methyltransferase domain-containing protein [Kofleriaceae bacterium]
MSLEQARPALARSDDRASRLRRYYAAWAATYGDPSDDGWFARIRSRERRLVEELLALAGSESILDAGCGAGVHAKPLASRGHEVWAVDLVPEMVARVASHVHRACVADLEQLALGRQFDRVMCLGVLEFVADPGAVMRALADHLVPDGVLVVLVPRPTLAGRIYQLTKAWHGVSARPISAAELTRLGACAGLARTAVRYPFVHNVVMAFRR